MKPKPQPARDRPPAERLLKGLENGVNTAIRNAGLTGQYKKGHGKRNQWGGGKGSSRFTSRANSVLASTAARRTTPPTSASRRLKTYSTHGMKRRARRALDADGKSDANLPGIQAQAVEQPLKPPEGGDKTTLLKEAVTLIIAARGGGRGGADGDGHVNLMMQETGGQQGDDGKQPKPKKRVQAPTAQAPEKYTIVDDGDDDLSEEAAEDDADDLQASMAALSLNKVKESMKVPAESTDTCYHTVKPKAGGEMKRCPHPRMPGLFTCKMHTKCRLSRKTPEDRLKYVKGRKFKLGEWCLASLELRGGVVLEQTGEEVEMRIAGERRPGLFHRLFGRAS